MEREDAYDIVDIEDSVTSTNQQSTAFTLVSHSALLQLFRFIRLLVSKHNPSPWSLGFILTIQTMQILSYPFGGDNSGGTVSHLAANALTITNLRFLDDSGRYNLLVVVLIAILLYALLAVTTAWRLFKSNSLSDDQNQQVSAQIVAEATFAMISWLSVPLLDALISPVFSTGRNSLAFVAALLIFPLMSAFVVLVKGAMICLDPFSNSALAQSHSRFDIAASAFRCVVILLFNASGGQAASFICLLPSLAIAYFYAILGPYHSTLTNQFHSISSFLIFWSFFCKVIATIVSSNVGLQVFLISAPFITGAAFFLVRIRQTMIMDISPLLMKDACQVQIRIHQMLNPIRVQRQSRIKRNLQANQDNALMDTVQNVFTQTTTTLPNSAMLQIFRAMFFLFYRRNVYATLLHLRSAERLAPSMDLSYIIYVMRSSIAEIISSDSESKATAEFAEFSSVLTKAIDADSDATQLHIQFWSSLDRASNEDLDKISADINKALVNATQSYDRCLEIAPTSDTVKRLYAGFTRDVLHDQATANGIINDLERYNAKSMFDGSLQKNFTQNLFDEDNPVVMVSGNPERLGQIIDCNSAAVSRFGYETKAALVQNNVSALIPPPICTFHSSLMRTNLELGRHSFRHSTRSVFAMHRSGFLIPIYLYVTWFSSSLEDISLIGLMSLDHPDRNSHLAVVDMKTGLLTAVNESFATMFDIELKSVVSGKIAIEQIISIFNRDISLFLQPNGSIVKVSDLHRRPFDLKLTEMRVTVSLLADVYLVRIHQNRPKHFRSTTIPLSRISSHGSQPVSASAGIELELKEDASILTPKIRNRKQHITRTGSQAFTTLSGNTVFQSQSVASSISVISNEIRSRIRMGNKAQVSMRSRRFGILFYAMNFAIMILAISTYTVTSSMLSSFSSSVDFMISTGNHQRFDSMKISDRIHRLILLRQQVMNNTVDNAPEVILADLFSTTDRLSSSIDQVYIARSSLDNQHLDLLDHKVVNALELDSSEKVSSNVYTLLDFGLLLMASGRYTAHLALEAITISDYQVAFALMNGAYAGVQWYDKTSGLLQTQSEALYSSTRLLVSVLSLLAVAIVFVSIYVVIRPAIRRLRLVNDTISGLFQLIPSTVSGILRQHYGRRAALHHAIHTDGLHNNNDLKSYFEKSGYFEDRQSIFSGDIGHERPMRRATKSYDIRTIAKVSAGVMLCITYFVATYLTGLYNVQDTMLYKPAECNWSSYRRMATLKVVMFLRTLAAQGGSHQVLVVTLSDVSTAINDLERVHDGLVQGNSAMGTAPVNSLYNLQDDILNSNGCTPPTWNDCLQFQNKILQGGLNAGLREFIARARAAVSAISSTCGPCLRANQMQQALATPDLILAQTLYDKYLAPTLGVSVDRYQQAMHYKMLTEYQQISVILLAVFMLLIIALLIIVYRPMIRNYDLNLKNKQTMLLMVPEHIIKTNSRLRSHLEANSQSLLI